MNEMVTYTSLTLPEASTLLDELQKEAATAHRRVHDIVRCKITYQYVILLIHCLKKSSELSGVEKDLTKNGKVLKDGPFYSSLERTLQKLNVKRQAYHGGTFIGNHVHKLLKVRARPCIF